MCFLGRVLLNNLINLSIIAFIKKALKLGADICKCAFYLITKKSIREYEKKMNIRFGNIASYAKL